MTTHFHYLPDEVQQELRCIAETLLTPGKGILTADESASTIGKRLQEVGMHNDEDTRRKWRLLLFSTAQIEEYISGVVLIDETLHQKDDSGKLLVDYLKDRCIIPGIKVDSGLVLLPGSHDEVFTQGMDDLGARLAEYKQKGCEFARWRCVFKIGENIPSRRAIISNVDELARFASICQSQRICPLIEPEVVPEGNHDTQSCEQVTETVLSFVFRALNEHQVFLEGIVLKPNMVMAGLSHSQQAHPDNLAEATITALQRTVPPAVPGIAFTASGQNEDEATANLNAIVCALGKKPWYLTFAFGRALQASAMRTWAGNASNITAAQSEFLRRVKENGDATCGVSDDGRLNSDVFSPISITMSTPTRTSQRQSDSIVSSPIEASKRIGLKATKTPELTPINVYLKDRSRKVKKGLFSFLRRGRGSAPSSLERPSILERDNEGDIVEPVAFMTRKEISTSSARSPKSDTIAPLPGLQDSTPISMNDSPIPEKDSPSTASGTPKVLPRSTSVGISRRVAPTNNADPDSDTLEHGLEFQRHWKTAEWDETIIAHKLLFYANES